MPQDINYDPTWSSVGVEWLGVCARGLLLCRRVSPCLRPSLKDVRNYDTPIREQQAAVTVRYTRRSAVAVEPLRLWRSNHSGSRCVCMHAHMYAQVKNGGGGEGERRGKWGKRGMEKQKERKKYRNSVPTWRVSRWRRSVTYASTRSYCCVVLNSDLKTQRYFRKTSTSCDASESTQTRASL